MSARNFCLRSRPNGPKVLLLSGDPHPLILLSRDVDFLKFLILLSRHSGLLSGYSRSHVTCFVLSELLQMFNASEQKMSDLKTTTKGHDTKVFLMCVFVRSVGLRWAMMSLTMSFLGETKVAFAAALTDSGSVGPFDRETTLIFSKVFTNVGRAYDENSGEL